MLRFLAARLLQSALVLVAVYTFTFLLLMAAPGDPFIGEKNVLPAVRQAIAERYDLPYLALPPAQRAQLSWPRRAGFLARAYVAYVRRLLTNDAPSIEYQNFTVSEVISSSLPVSISLGSLALLIALWLGVATGTLGGLTRGRWPDLALTVLTLFGVSLPTFVLASLALMLFGVYWPVLPTGGWGKVSQLVLPACTLSLFYLAYIARLTRVSVLDVVSQDYVRTARAKGLPFSRVVSLHILRNAALPVLSFLGPAAATVLTGSFVVEKVFAIPGLGTHFVNACLNLDLPLVLGAVLVYTALIVAFNLLVDLAYLFLDPRISLR